MKTSKFCLCQAQHGQQQGQHDKGCHAPLAGGLAGEVVPRGAASDIPLLDINGMAVQEPIC